MRCTALPEGLAYDRSLITAEFLDAGCRYHRRWLRRIFSRDVHGRQAALYRSVRIVAEELCKFDCDVVMMHGREDLPIPAAEIAWRWARAARVPCIVGTDNGVAVIPYREWHARELEPYVKYLGFSTTEALYDGWQHSIASGKR